MNLTLEQQNALKQVLYDTPLGELEPAVLPLASIYLEPRMVTESEVHRDTLVQFLASKQVVDIPEEHVVCLHQLYRQLRDM